MQYIYNIIGIEEGHYAGTVVTDCPPRNMQQILKNISRNGKNMFDDDYIPTIIGTLQKNYTVFQNQPNVKTFDDEGDYI